MDQYRREPSLAQIFWHSSQVYAFHNASRWFRRSKRRTKVQPTACSVQRNRSGEPHDTPRRQRSEDGFGNPPPRHCHPPPSLLFICRPRTRPRQHTRLHPSNTDPTTMAAPTRRGDASRYPSLNDHSHCAIDNNGIKWHPRDNVQHALPRVLRPQPPGDRHLQARCLCG